MIKDKIEAELKARFVNGDVILKEQYNIGKFFANFVLEELSKTKVRKKTSEPELSLEAKAFVAKMFPCEPPCDSYGVCSNCCEASVFYAGYNMGFDASNEQANHINLTLHEQITELEQQLKDEKCFNEAGSKELNEACSRVKELEQQLSERDAEIARLNQCQKDAFNVIKSRNDEVTALEQQLKKAEKIVIKCANSEHHPECESHIRLEDETVEETCDCYVQECKEYLKSRGE